MVRPARLAIIVLAALTALASFAPAQGWAAGVKVHINKIDEGFSALPGATITLYRDDPPVGGGPPKGAEDTIAIGTCTTGANGQCDITGVPEGDYWVSETTTPSGYDPAADSQLKVKKKNREVTLQNIKQGSSSRVNDPTGDTAVGDGTNISQFGPHVAVFKNDIFIAFNDSTGWDQPDGVSAIGAAFSHNGGRDFVDLGEVPTGTAANYLVGEPAVTYDRANGTFLLAVDSFVLDGQDVTAPILVLPFDPLKSGFGGPVDTFPGIAPYPANAHTSSFAVDDFSGSPYRGNVYLSFTLSDGSGGNEGMISRSKNGGATWSPPISVTGPGTTDFFASVIDARGYVNTVWGDYGGPSAGAFDIFFSRSVDGGKTFSTPAPVASGLPKSGTVGSCGGSSLHTYMGQMHGSEALGMVFDPHAPSHGAITATVHGAGADEADIVVSTSTDGGKNWSATETLFPSAGGQFYPSVGATPDGRFGIGYYQQVDGTSQLNVVMSVYDMTWGDHFTAQLRGTAILNEEPFPLSQMNPQFDSLYNDCFGLEEFNFAAPGSGFSVAWTDMRDPGPLGNNGVDPNIYFEEFEGWSTPTTTRVVVKKGVRKLTVRGAVNPSPHAPVLMNVRLLVDTGGGFVKVDRARPRLNDAGRYRARLDRPPFGTCMIVARFRGSDGRLPSTASKTFRC